MGVIDPLDIGQSKMVGMLFGIVPIFVPNGFVPDCFVAHICANLTARTHVAHFGAYLRDADDVKQSRTNSVSANMNIETIPKNMLTKFELASNC